MVTVETVLLWTLSFGIIARSPRRASSAKRYLRSLLRSLVHLVFLNVLGTLLFREGTLLKFTSFSSLLRCLEGKHEIGKHRGSHVELLILYGVWIGHRSLLEKTVPTHKQPGEREWFPHALLYLRVDRKGWDVRLQVAFFMSGGNGWETGWVYSLWIGCSHVAGSST